MAFSATRAAFEGFRVIGRRPVTIVVWAIVFGLISAVMFAAVCYFMGASFIGDVIRHQGDPGYYRNLQIDSPEEAWAFVRPILTGMAFIVPIALVVASVQLAAVYRTVLRPNDRGFAYLRLGGDELRQLGLIVLIVLFYAFLECVFFLGIVFGLRALDLEGAAQVALIVGWCALFVVVLVTVGVRLSLAPAMTFAQRRIRFFGSWSLTKGHFWPLVGMYLLAMVFTIVAALLIKIAANGVGGAMGFSLDALFSGDQLNFDPETFDFNRLYALLGAGGLAFAAVHAIGRAMLLPIWSAPQAEAYRELTEARNPPAPEPVAAPPPPADHGHAEPAPAADQGATDSQGAEAAALAAGAAIAAGAAAFAAEAPPQGHGHPDALAGPGDGHGDAPAPAPEAPPEAPAIQPEAYVEPAAASPEPAPVEPFQAEPAPEARVEPAPAEPAPEAHGEPAAAEPPAEPAPEAHPDPAQESPPAAEAHPASPHDDPPAAEPGHADPDRGH